VFVYAGIKGHSISSGFRSLLGGHVPTDTTLPPDLGGMLGSVGGDVRQLLQNPPGSAGGPPAAGPAAGGGQAIVAAAMAYYHSGSVYRMGGANPQRGWDCSGYVNWVLCHDLGLPIPGYRAGSFTGRVHGPVTAIWPFWSGAVSVPRDAVRGGDLVIWPFRHMGIAVDNTSMINCPGPNGTPAPVLSSIAHHASLGIPVYRRLKITPAGTVPRNAV